MLEANSLRELIPMIEKRIAKVGQVPGFVIFEGSEKVLCEVYFATGDGIPTVRYFDYAGAQTAQLAPIAGCNADGSPEATIWKSVVGQDALFV